MPANDLPNFLGRKKHPLVAKAMFRGCCRQLWNKKSIPNYSRECFFHCAQYERYVL